MQQLLPQVPRLENLLSHLSCSHLSQYPNDYPMLARGSVANGSARLSSGSAQPLHQETPNLALAVFGCLWLSLSCFRGIRLGLKIWKNLEKS